MKSLKPTQRESKRYLLIKGKNASWKAVEEVILEFIGVLGFAEASPQPIKETKDGIIVAINREALNKVRAALLVSGRDLRIVKVSGMIGNLK